LLMVSLESSPCAVVESKLVSRVFSACIDDRLPRPISHCSYLRRGLVESMLCLGISSSSYAT
jgi:hypothetical protein